MSDEIQQGRGQASASLACSHSRRTTVGQTRWNHWMSHVEWCPECGAMRYSQVEGAYKSSPWQTPLCGANDQGMGSEKDRLAAIHRKASEALNTSWLYSGKEHVEQLMREIAAISSENA